MLINILPVDERRAGQLAQHRLHPAADVEPPVVPGTGVGHGGAPRHCQAQCCFSAIQIFF